MVGVALLYFAGFVAGIATMQMASWLRLRRHRKCAVCCRHDSSVMLRSGDIRLCDECTALSNELYGMQEEWGLGRE